jgi:hypothetical protein
MAMWAPRLLTVLTGRNPSKIRQTRKAQPSTINEKTIARGQHIA